MNDDTIEIPRADLIEAHNRVMAFCTAVLKWTGQSDDNLRTFPALDEGAAAAAAMGNLMRHVRHH
ncbi:MAG: hypothetical protein R8L07_03655 [Alphaproteobacteria bacterium]|nr:hypothetical protein [Alphaproteobacteria bacterium]